MKEKVLIVFLFAFLSFFIFRNYFFKNTVPFPGNLLVSFYQPWMSYPTKDYPHGPANKPIGFDNLRIFYPLRKLTIEQIKKFAWPIWNPYNFSGNTQLADYQSAVFHPLSFLFLLLPQIDAWSIIIILTPFFAGIFMYAFLREINLGKRASLFGAIVFAFSGFMIVWWEEMFMSAYSALFLPLVLYGIEKIYKKITAFSFLVLVLSLAFSVLSGFFQMTFYLYLFSFAWLVHRYFKERNKKAFLFGLTAFVLSLVISGIHLVPSFEAYRLSARGTTDIKNVFNAYLVPLYYLSTFIAADFFGNPATYNFLGKDFYREKVFFVGLPALIFALYELFSFKNIISKEKFFKTAFLLTLSLSLALPTSWLFLYYLKLPIFSVILPSRITFLATFSISLLASYGLSRFLKEKNKKRIFLVFGFLGMSLLGMWAYGFYYNSVHQSSIYRLVFIKNLILPSLIFFLSFLAAAIYLVKSKLAKPVFLFFMGISFFSSAYLANKYLFFSERRFTFPETPLMSELKNISGIDRFWGLGEGYIDKNFATYYRLFSPEGFDSYYPKRYGELLFAAQNNGKLSSQIPRTDATLSNVKNLNEIFENPFRRKLMALLGVRYLVTTIQQKADKTFLASFSPKWSDDKFIIYENKNVLPRIFVASKYLVIKDAQEILDHIFSDKIDLAKTIILEEDLGEKFDEAANGKIKLVSYEPNKIDIEANLDKKSLLFLSDNYYPGWKAYVDNKATKIHRADYSFRAIVVPEGEHAVFFKYEPESLRVGIVLTLAGLFSLVIIFLLSCVNI